MGVLLRAAEPAEGHPPWLSFEVLSDPPERIYPGLPIEYRVRPPWGVPVQWPTEITHVVEPSLFVDEQRFGPYRLWHHQHRFHVIDGGVEVEDEVHYRLPGGPIGRTGQRLRVRRRLAEIFGYRGEAVERIFGRLQATGLPTRGTAPPRSRPGTPRRPR